MPGRPSVPAARRVVAAAGRVMVAAGIVLLLFVAYLLWGTGLIESSHQQALRRAFDSELAVAGHGAATRPAGVPGISSLAAAGAVPPAPGRPVAILEIPRIGLDSVVVQGTGPRQLRLGPGHYIGTPFPGQAGNAALAGHRTTYGAPFADLGELRPGDDVWATTIQGRFRYVVVRSFVLTPADVAVIGPSSTPELTLTTCTPPYSAAERLVVRARLVGRVAPAPTPTAALAVGPGSGALAGQVGSPAGAVGWGAVCAGLALVVWVAGRGRRHRWLVHLVGALPVLAALFLCFQAVGPLLPASF